MNNPTYISRIREHLHTVYLLNATKTEQQLPIFLQALEKYILQLEATLVSGDLQQLRKTSHAVKGALLHLGLPEVAEQASYIEQQSKSGNTTLDYQPLITRLAETIQTIVHSE